MLNEKYTGEFTFGGRRCDNMYPAIVDKDLFERVGKRLTENKYTAGGQATAKEPYLLSHRRLRLNHGLALCFWLIRCCAHGLYLCIKPLARLVLT